MGIPSYFSFLVKNYTRILKNIKHFDNKIIHNLLLDSNSIIYEALNNNINILMNLLPHNYLKIILLNQLIKKQGKNTNVTLTSDKYI